jgi:hypothetical protein
MMDIQQLRQSLKMKWLSYYEQNRYWLVKMRVWQTYDGLRRPSSGYILATLSVLEPEFEQILPFILELNNNPDQIITALGLNFNPDEELSLLQTLANQANHQIVSHPLARNSSKNTTTSQVHHQSDHSHYNSSVSQPLPKDSQQELFRVSTVNDEQQKLVPMVAATSQSNTCFPPKDDSLDSREILEVLEVRGEEITSVILHQEESNQSPTKIPVCEQPPAVVLEEDKPEKSRLLTSEILTIPKTASALPELASNGKIAPIPEQKVPHPLGKTLKTHARSLATWVDEFCQGIRWVKQERNSNG